MNIYHEIVRQLVIRVRAPEEGVRFLLGIGWRLPMLRLVIAVTATATTVAATDNVVAAPTIAVPSPPLSPPPSLGIWVSGFLGGWLVGLVDMGGDRPQVRDQPRSERA